VEPGQLWAFAVFSLVGSFTPGPNTAIATATAANFGFRATVPHILGVPVGFSTLLGLGSLGVAGVLLSLPAAALVLRWTGIAYLLYLAWLLARAPRPAGTGAAGRLAGRPLTFVESALFQYANPKAWMLVVATAATYMTGAGVATRIGLICGVWSIACVASLVAWAWMGAALRRPLKTGRRLRWFNAAMGGSLAATALWMAVAT
jgi:threonine/homoserine/homoserine lactone efflux protein